MNDFIQFARQQGRQAYPNKNITQCPYNPGFEGPLFDAWVEGYQFEESKRKATSMTLRLLPAMILVGLALILGIAYFEWVLG